MNNEQILWEMANQLHCHLQVVQMWAKGEIGKPPNLIAYTDEVLEMAKGVLDNIDTSKLK